MKRIARNLTIIFRTERLIMRRKLAVAQRQTVLLALAGLAALAGLILLNITLYLVLAARVSPEASAGLLTVGNLLLAVLLSIISGRININEEIAPALEVQDLAIAEIEDDLEAMLNEARDAVGKVKSLGSNPLGSLSAILVPVVAAILKNKEKQ